MFKPTSDQKVRILVALIGLIGALGTALIASRYVSNPSTPTEVTPAPDGSGLVSEPVVAPKPKVFVLDSPVRRNVVDRMLTDLSDSKDIEANGHVSRTDWLKQVKDLADHKPALLIAHWHTLRTEDVSSAQDPDRLAEEELLRGLHALQELSPQTEFALYSRSFANQSLENSLQDVLKAARRAARGDEALAEAYGSFARKISLIPWAEPPRTEDRLALDAALRSCRRCRRPL